ncbi:hypothetical protein [Actinophytocola oryzae]|uniref:LPXTG-motif cell wall-anchored protein n=1 Tax=Actinophytocola oryzae TaxID=502181 RepID=A0A4R7VWE5_9PSEU|nr:hypothetical protein [Actinophytocola oryzae]TDV53968.1 hypothetical protein CLV71_104437 [Actinophytocola oryzae]
MSRAVATVMVLAVLALAGCSTVTNLVAVSNDIQDAGYAFASLHVESTSGQTVVAVDTTTATGTEVTSGDADEIAEIVWRKYDASFDKVRVTINGTQTLTETEGDLKKKFGDRPDGLPTTGSEATKATLMVVGASLAGLLVGGFILLMWWRGRTPPPPVVPPTLQYPPPS